MIIEKTLLPQEKLKPLFEDPLKLQFGRTFTDYMFTMTWRQGTGWHLPEIKPYGPLALDPSASVLHYSQEVFEGQKAYLSAQGRILLFRPRDNARRMNRSLHRLCMPEIPEGEFLAAEYELLKLEKRWIPGVVGAALYLRPTVIATEAALGVRPANEYLFYIILSPVGPYFAEGFRPISLFVSEEYTRAALGGTGEAKTGGNYAGSLLASQQAKEKGFSQVLWLDAQHHRFIEEVGAMNIFFVRQGKLVTPKLSGSILRGITRQSILELAPTLGLPATEETLAIDEITAAIERGEVTEAFAAGTAAVVSPVGCVHYHGRDFNLNQGTGPWTQRLFDELTGIQYGKRPDPFQWVVTVD